MIEYKIGDLDCKLDWDNFLVLETHSKTKLYKKDFNNFPELYEFLDKNIKHIKKLIFDNYSYKLKNGLIHNLNGYAFSKYVKGGYGGDKMVHRYYINGKMVYHFDVKNRPVTCNLEFFTSKIFFIDRDDGEGYINLNGLRREEKLERILK